MTITMLFGFIMLCLAVFAVWFSTVLYVVLAAVTCGILAAIFAVIAWSTGAPARNRSGI